jgi:adenylylsulfate kinase-like enzyme
MPDIDHRTRYLDSQGNVQTSFAKQAQALYVPLSENKRRVLLITGLPGSGKTDIAVSVAQRLRGVHINGDTVRSTINAGLDFSEASRIKQATTMGQLARIVADSGVTAVVDFVCPILATRHALLDALGHHRSFATWVEISRPSLVSRFEDTRKLYVQLKDSVPDLNLLPNQITTIVNEEGSSADTKNSVVSFYWTCAQV